MSAIRYGETVTLLIPYEQPRTMTLADAVFTVLQSEDRIKRTGAKMVRENTRRSITPIWSGCTTDRIFPITQSKAIGRLIEAESEGVGTGPRRSKANG